MLSQNLRVLDTVDVLSSNGDRFEQARRGIHERVYVKEGHPRFQRDRIEVGLKQVDDAHLTSDVFFGYDFLLVVTSDEDVLFREIERGKNAVTMAETRDVRHVFIGNFLVLERQHPRFVIRVGHGHEPLRDFKLDRVKQVHTFSYF